jgi:hypothetical protein
VVGDRERGHASFFDEDHVAAGIPSRHFRRLCGPACR